MSSSERIFVAGFVTNYIIGIFGNCVLLLRDGGCGEGVDCLEGNMDYLYNDPGCSSLTDLLLDLWAGLVVDIDELAVGILMI
jgi:hypothetical protein